MDCDCHSWANSKNQPIKNGHNPLCPKSIILHAFRNNEGDMFVAETVEETRSMYRQFCKNTGVEDDVMDVNFTQCDDGEFIRIQLDDMESSAVSKTCAQWCSSNGKGFLCTENF